MAVQVHAQKRTELNEARVHPAPKAGMGQRHPADQVLFKPFNGFADGQLVHLGGVDAAVHRAGHQGQAARLGRVVVFRHDGGGRQCRHTRLAHGHQVRAGTNGFGKANHVVDVIVQPKRAVVQAHVPGVVPVGDVDIVVLQQGACSFTQQGGKVTRQGGHQQHRRLVGQVGGRVFFEAQQGSKRQSQDAFFRDSQLPLPHLHRSDAVSRASVGESQARENVHGGRHFSHQAALGLVEPQRGAAALGQQAKGRQQVVLRLVGLVKHGFPQKIKRVARVLPLNASCAPVCCRGVQVGITLARRSHDVSHVQHPRSNFHDPSRLDDQQ